MTFIGPRPDTPIGSAAYTDEEKIILPLHKSHQNVSVSILRFHK